MLEAWARQPRTTKPRVSNSSLSRRDARHSPSNRDLSTQQAGIEVATTKKGGKRRSKLSYQQERYEAAVEVAGVGDGGGWGLRAGARREVANAAARSRFDWGRAGRDRVRLAIGRASGGFACLTDSDEVGYSIGPQRKRAVGPPYYWAY
jgi:hypothetical protein